MVWRPASCFSDGSCWEIIIIKQIHTFTSNILIEQRRFGLGCPSLYIKIDFDLIKAGATQTETSLLNQYVAGECVECWKNIMLTQSDLITFFLSTSVSIHNESWFSWWLWHTVRPAKSSVANEPTGKNQPTFSLQLAEVLFLQKKDKKNGGKLPLQNPSWLQDRDHDAEGANVQEQAWSREVRLGKSRPEVWFWRHCGLPLPLCCGHRHIDGFDWLTWLPLTATAVFKSRHLTRARLECETNDRSVAQVIFHRLASVSVPCSWTVTQALEALADRFTRSTRRGAFRPRNSFSFRCCCQPVLARLPPPPPLRPLRRLSTHLPVPSTVRQGLDS